MEKKSYGISLRGLLLCLYLVIGYAVYTAFTNFPQNVMAGYFGGQNVTSTVNLVGGLLSYLITYFIVSPRIGRIKNMKRISIIISAVGLVFSTGIMLIPPEQTFLWCVAFTGVIIFPAMSNSFITIMLGNWFPTRKGVMMGWVTMAFPIVTGICLGIFQSAHGVAMAEGASLMEANIRCFAPYWILCVVGMLIAGFCLKDFPEQCGEYRDNNKNFDYEMAKKMLERDLENRRNSVWKRSKIWGCKDWWLLSIGSGLLLSTAIAFMVQIIPVLAQHYGALMVLAVPGFSLMSNGISAVLFGLAIFACFGSWFLGVIDDKYGTKTAIFITAVLMTISGILGMINNVWCVVAATWILGLFMGASSNFGLSGLVRYWRIEDFPAVMTGAPPLGTVIGAAFPLVISSLATKWSYTVSFGFIVLLGIIAAVCSACFNPLGVAKYDNKLRAAAGLPTDDVLEQRYYAEKNKRKNKAAK